MWRFSTIFYSPSFHHSPVFLLFLSIFPTDVTYIKPTKLLTGSEQKVLKEREMQQHCLLFFTSLSMKIERSKRSVVIYTYVTVMIIIIIMIVVVKVCFLLVLYTELVCWIIKSAK